MITLTTKMFPQPTLSLYLGGSGILVGDCLLHILGAIDPVQREFFKPYFIDSQEPGIDYYNHTQHFCYTDLNLFFDPIYEAFTRHRFPPNLGDEPVWSSVRGCGVTRIFGAASLAACLDRFDQQIIEPAVKHLREIRTESTQPLQVFITASACGGTGAGMVLDAAALVRYFFKCRGENPQIFLFLVGPTVYIDNAPMTEEQKNRMRATAYALLKEMNHFANGKPFVSAYRLRDKIIQIGNTKDDDRLFDWVYYIDGRGERSGATRGVEEVMWSIAEVQAHLAFTEVGRKVTESMPNQRELRARRFAENYVYYENKERMSPAEHLHLEVSSRKAFLASFSVRNVRFPAEDIKTWFRCRWVRDGLEKVLRRERSTKEALIDEFDRLLGYSDRTIQPAGLLADLGLTHEQLLSHIDLLEEKMKKLSGMLAPERLIAEATAIVDQCDWVIKDLKTSISLVAGPSDGESSVAALVEATLPEWSKQWNASLQEKGKISEMLWDLAWNRASGRGLRFLDDFLLRTARVLTDLAAAAAQRPPLKEIEQEVGDIRDSLNTFEKKVGIEKKKPAFALRAFIAKKRDVSPFSDDINRKAQGLAKRLNALQELVARQRKAHIAASLAPRAWMAAADALKRWRDETLRPTITAADNAFTLANNRLKLARAALATHRVPTWRGICDVRTTVQLADDALLAELAVRVIGIDPIDLVIAPLHGQGISSEGNRLTILSLVTLDRQTSVEMLLAHVGEATKGALTFLDNGWMLDEVERRLHDDGARVLDTGAEPLATFSQSAVGQQPLSFLLRPPDLQLPRRFGRSLSSMTKFSSSDPMQVGVVSFVFGIPTNSLEQMRELFEQYTVHLGDQERNKAHDRYPLHIFANAAEEFDEPYSPLAFLSGDAHAMSLLDAAQRLWGADIHLVIRPFDAKKIATDSNLRIELTEKILSYLTSRPKKAARLFKNISFPELEALYYTRTSSRTPPTSRGNSRDAEDDEPAPPSSNDLPDNRSGWPV